MADEQTTQEQSEKEPVEAAPVAAEQPTAEPAGEDSVAAAEQAEAPEPEPVAAADQDAAPEPEPAQGEAQEPAPAAEPQRTSAAVPAEPAVVLAPKERRRRRRAAKAPATRGPLAPTERQAERDATRAAQGAARRTRRAKVRAKRPERAAEPAPAVEHAVGRLKVRQGVVTSDKADKTITVRVDTSRRHRRYQKIVRSSKTLHAHDEHNDAHEGDVVRVIETRPLSATKRWRLDEVLERAR